MDSSLKARGNHYETLGLTPAATAAEIAQAFARKMSAFAARPLVAAAELSIAFETLREPERRRAYDASLRPPPPPPPQQPAYTVKWSSGPFMTAAVAVPPARPARAEPRSEAAIEPQPFIASTEPVRMQAPEIFPVPTPQAQERQPQPRPEPFVEQQRPIQCAIEPGPAAQPESPTGLNRIAVVVGGVVAGVAVLGAVAGWSAGLVEQSQQPEAHVTTPLPRAKPLTTAAAAEPVSAWTVAQAPPQRPRQTAAARVGRSSSVPRALPLEGLQAEASQSALDQNGSAVAETPAAVVSASLSLPNPVIARTIGRIGYPCGEVASTTAVDGGNGVFKVTCTSGHSYQAALVRGRYHFRRWSNR